MAKREFSTIMGKIETMEAYPTEEDLKNDLQRWLKKYKTPSTGQKMNAVQKVLFLGSL
jgi:hypothetical protein